MNHLIRIEGYSACYEVEEALKDQGIKWRQLPDSDPLLEEHGARSGAQSQFFFVVSHEDQAELEQCLEGQGPGAVIVASYEPRMYPAT